MSTTVMSKPIVEALFGAGARARIVQFLFVEQPAGKRIAARALARAAQVPYGSIHKTLAELVADQLVVREDSEHGPLYRAPLEDPRLQGLVLLLRQDSQIVAALTRAVRRFKAIAYAGIFGSFASGKTHRNSDVDVLVLERAELDRFAVMTELGKVAHSIGREVNPEFYGQEEFREKVEQGDSIALAILGNPRIDLKGDIDWQK
jgi:predicted nucleotidyltransferase